MSVYHNIVYTRILTGSLIESKAIEKVKVSANHTIWGHFKNKSVAPAALFSSVMAFANISGDHNTVNLIDGDQINNHYHIIIQQSACIANLSVPD